MYQGLAQPLGPMWTEAHIKRDEASVPKLEREGRKMENTILKERLQSQFTVVWWSKVSL